MTGAYFIIHKKSGQDLYPSPKAYGNFGRGVAKGVIEKPYTHCYMKFACSHKI